MEITIYENIRADFDNTKPHQLNADTYVQYAKTDDGKIAVKLTYTDSQHTGPSSFALDSRAIDKFSNLAFIHANLVTREEILDAVVNTRLHEPETEYEEAYDENGEKQMLINDLLIANLIMINRELKQKQE